MPNLTNVTQLLTKALEGFVTTLAQPASYNATTLSLTSFSNGNNASYNNNDYICIVINPGTSQSNTVVGTVALSTLTLTNCVWTEGGNNNHLAGETVADYPTATDWDGMQEAFLTQHDQQGNILPNSVTSSMIVGTTASTINNPYKFLVFWANGQSNYLSGTGSIIKYDTKIFDTGNNFSTSTFLFTAPIAGFYWFGAGMAVNNGTNVGYGSIYFINGGDAFFNVETPTSAYNNNALIGTSGMLQLAAGATVGVYGTVGSSTSVQWGVTGGVDFTYFNGFLVSAT